MKNGKLILIFLLLFYLMTMPASLAANVNSQFNPVIELYQRQLQTILNYDLSTIETSKMADLKDVKMDAYRLENTIRRTKDEVLDYYSSVLYGAMPSYTCNVSNNELVITTGQFYSEDRRVLLSRWQRLIENGFTLANIYLDSSSLIKGLKLDNGNVPKAKYCKSLAAATQALTCFYSESQLNNQQAGNPQLEDQQSGVSQSSNTCLENYSNTIGGDIVVGVFNQKERALLGAIAPFFAITVESKLSTLQPQNDGADYILQVLLDGFDEAIKLHNQWESALALAQAVEQFDPWVLQAMGVNPADAKTLLERAVYSKKIPRASSQYIEAVAAEVGLIATIERIKNTRDKAIAFRSQVETGMQQLQNVQFDKIVNQAKNELKNYVTDTINTHDIADKTTPKLVLSGKLNGQYDADGTALYNVELSLLLPSKDAFINISKTLKNRGGDVNPLACDADKCSAKVIRANSKVALGITISNVKQLPNDAGWRLIKDRFNPVNARIRLTGEQITQVLRAYGVLTPFPFNSSDTNIAVSDDLNTLSLIVKVNNLFSPNADIILNIPLLKNAELVSPLEVNHAIAEQINKQIIIEYAANWFNKLDFVQSADQSVDKVLVLIAKNTVSSTPILAKKDEKGRWGNQIIGYSIKAPFVIKSNDSDIQTSLPQQPLELSLNVTQDGIKLNINEFTSAVEQQLSEAIRVYLGKSIRQLGLEHFGEDAISLVSPYFKVKNNTLIFKIDYILSGSFSGCDIRHKLTTDFAFFNVNKQIESLGQVFEKKLKECAKQQSIAQVSELLNGKSISFFGIKASIPANAIVPSGDNFKFSLQLDDAQSSTSVRVDGATFRLADHKVDFKTIDQSSKHRAGVAFGKIITHRLNALLGGDAYYQISNSVFSDNGYSFDLVLKQVPYVYELRLERITIGKFSQNIEKTLKQAVTNVVNEALSAAINRNQEIPDVGPIVDIKVDKAGFYDDGLNLSFKGNLALYQGMALPVSVKVLPLGCKLTVNQNNACISMGDPKALLSSVLSGVMQEYVPLKFPGTPIELAPLPVIEYMPETASYGVTFGLKIDLDIVKIQGAGARLTTKGIYPPHTIGANVGAEIPIPPFTISNPGITYTFTNGGGFGINGNLTFAKKEIEHILHINSQLNLVDVKSLEFTLNGDMVVANMLSVYTTTGRARLLNDPLIDYQSGTSPILKAVIDAQQSGRLDGKGRYAETKSRFSIIGININDSEYRIDIPSSALHDAKMRFSGSQNLLIGKADVRAGTDLLLRKPSAEANVNIKIGGWDVLKGGIKISMPKTHLKFKALGININVITPGLGGLTPGLLSRILADLLKIDIKSLLKKPKLNDITVSLMNKDGSPNNQSANNTQASSSDGGSAGTTPDNVGTPPVDPKEGSSKKESKKEKSRNKVHEMEPLTQGYFACLEMFPGRYEFWRKYGAYKKDEGHKHRADYKHALEKWHSSTFINKESIFVDGALANLCHVDRLNDDVWLPIAARQSIAYDQYGQYDCGADNTMDITITSREKASWNEDGQGYYCGSISNAGGQGFKSQVRYKSQNPVEVDEDYFKNVERKINSSFAEKYEQIKRTLYDEVVSKVPDNAIPQFEHPKTRLEFNKTSNFMSCWFSECLGEIELTIYSKPKTQTHDWRQSFQLLYNKKNNNVYYLSACELKNQLSGFDYSGETFNKFCRTEVKTIGRIDDILGSRSASVKAQMNEGKAWLNASEYYYLLERRAVPIFNNEKPQDNLFESFEIKEDGLTYSVQMMGQKNSLKTDREYYITLLGKSSEPKLIKFRQGHPLIKWFDLNTTLSKKLLIQYYKNENLQPAYEDFNARRLVLIDDSFEQNTQPEQIRSVWFGETESGVVSKRLNIKDFNPYKRQTLSRKELDNIYKTFFNDVLKEDWKHLSFGIAPLSKVEIGYFRSADQVVLKFMKLSELDELMQHAPTNFKSSSLLSLIECFGGNLEDDVVIDILLHPDSYYNTRLPNGKVMDEHPLSLLIEQCN